MSGYIDSTHARGFARWERARLNADAKPNSAGAKLYRKRRAIADAAAADPLLTLLGPVDHLAWQYVREGESLQPRVDFRTCSAPCAAMELQLLTNDKLGQDEVLEVLRGLAAGLGPWAPPRHPDAYYQPGPRLRVQARADHQRPARCHVCHATILPNGVVKPAEPVATQPSSAGLEAQLEALRSLLAQANTQAAAQQRKISDLEAQLAAAAKSASIDWTDLWILQDGALMPAEYAIVASADASVVNALNKYADVHGRGRFVSDNGGWLCEAVA